MIYIIYYSDFLPKEMLIIHTMGSSIQLSIDVPLSPKGVNEAKTTGAELASLHPHGITACFTSTLQRAKETAHYCIWAYGEKAIQTQPKQYVCDYRLNERHYGALQGLVKAQVEGGMYGHDPQDVQAWRRSWHAVPPLLEDDDPRRRHECKVFSNVCGGKENVPRGESLEMVARNRIQPFLEEKIHPILTQASDSESPDSEVGACGLVVAHANSLRALIGVLCQVENDGAALRRLEALKIQTGVPLILQYRKLGNGSYQACDIYKNYDENIDMQSLALTPDLPVWPLSCMPRESKKKQSLFGMEHSKGIRIDVI